MANRKANTFKHTIKVLFTLRNLLPSLQSNETILPTLVLTVLGSNSIFVYFRQKNTTMLIKVLQPDEDAKAPTGSSVSFTPQSPLQTGRERMDPS